MLRTDNGLDAVDQPRGEYRRSVAFELVNAKQVMDEFAGLFALILLNPPQPLHLVSALPQSVAPSSMRSSSTMTWIVALRDFAMALVR